VQVRTPRFPADDWDRLITRLLTGMFVGVMSAIQSNRASQFRALAIKPGKIVFLGDSITEGGLWNEWFPDIAIANRGTGGETTANLLARLETAINAPKAVFLLIGTNDISRGMPLAAIVANIRSILMEVERRAPGTPVYVQSVMPRGPAFKLHVKLLNQALRTLVAGQPSHVQYLDLWPALAAPDDTLRKDFTADRLHLNGPGYEVWVEVLRPYVENANTRTAQAAQR
jgi:lysophospholipase L1-like esterase